MRYLPSTVARWTPSCDDYLRCVIALAGHFALSVTYQANELLYRITGKGTFASAA